MCESGVAHGNTYITAQGCAGSGDAPNIFELVRGRSSAYSFQYINAAELPVPAGVRYSAW